MAEARWIRLLAEVRADRAAWEGHLAELEAVGLVGPPFDKGELARVALALDHGYCSLEALLARITRTLEASSIETSSWHRELLRSSSLELPELRPALLSVESLSGLSRLLSFRHFLRRACSTSLDGEALRDLRGRARALAPVLGADLDKVESWLESVASGS